MADSSRKGPILDRSRFTTAAAGRDMKNFSITKALEYDAYGTKIRFDVAVLTRPIPISSRDAKLVLKSEDAFAEADDKIGQITFMGRIDDADILYSPHITLPDPGSLEYGTEPQLVTLVSGMHCQFISVAGYTGKIPAIGDFVTVSLNYGDFSYNLQYAEFNELQQSFESSAQRPDKYGSLRTKFNNYKPERGATVGEITYRANTGAPTTYMGTKGEKRRINFASIKHRANCTPANKSSNDFKTYLGADSFERWRKELQKHEAKSYSTINSAGYMGMYQFGIAALETVGYLKSGTHASMGACKKQPVSCKATTDTILNNNSNWTGLDGVNNKADYLANKNGCQEKALNKLASGNLASLRKSAAIDPSNPNDVGGMVAAAHLRGTTVAKSMRNGNEVADGYGTFPSKYYTNMGAAVC